MSVKKTVIDSICKSVKVPPERALASLKVTANKCLGEQYV